MDSSPNNGSSIAFLFEINNFRILFLADAHPFVIAKSLKEQFKCTKNKKLKIDFVKLSHHGSKRNTSLKLLELIDCSNFIISTDGYSPHNHPHKETLAKIIHQRNLIQDENKRKRPINFYFNHKNNILDGIMKQEEREQHNVFFKFPKHDNRLEITWT